MNAYIAANTVSLSTPSLALSGVATDAAVSSSPDLLLFAKRELERTFAEPLYLRHLAALANMKPATFSRKFAARFGITPITYRLSLRLDEAARLAREEHALSIRQIALRVGFDDMPYFHRVFLKRFGTTPARFGGRVESMPPASSVNEAVPNAPQSGYPSCLEDGFLSEPMQHTGTEG